MKLRTSELKDLALDWAVTKCKGFDHSLTPGNEWGLWGWATDWAQGGPIIERECISIEDTTMRGGEGKFAWRATRVEGSSISEECGPTPLVAAMRCYVASQLGDEMDVPNELCN